MHRPFDAAASGLLDLGRLDWHQELIEKLGFQVLRWPRIRKFREVVGVVEIEGHRLNSLISNQQCALAGAGLQARELSLNISTGWQAGLIFGERPR